MQLRTARTRLAARQIRDAARWWRHNRTKTPTLFRDELRRALELIAEYPEAGVIAEELDLRDVRRVLMVATQHYIYYRVNVWAKRIDIISVWSTHRGEPPQISSDDLT